MSTSPPRPRWHKFYYELWHDRSWINRRIDEVKIISEDATETKSTFDLNIERLNELAVKHGIADSDRLVVPLLFQPRMPLLRVDIDLNGIPQSLAGTLQSASVSACICVHDILEHLTTDSSDEQFDRFYEPLYSWLIDGNMSKMYKDLNRILRDSDGSNLSRSWDVERWSDLEYSYIAVVCLDRLHRSQNAKLTCIFSTMYSKAESAEPSHFTPAAVDYYNAAESITTEPDMPESIRAVTAASSKRRLPSKLAVLPSKIIHAAEVSKLWLLPRSRDIPFMIPGTQLGTGFEERYHLKFQVPDGLLITSLSIYEEGIGPDRAILERPVYAHEKYAAGRCCCLACAWSDAVNARVASTSNSLEIHDLTKTRSGGTGRKYEIRIGMEPDPRIFKLPAVLCLYLLLLYTIIVRVATWSLPDLAVFTLTAAAFFVALPFLFRRYREHDFTSIALRRLRRVLGVLVATCLTGGLFNQYLKFAQGRTENGSEIKLSQLIDRWCENHSSVLDMSGDVVQVLGYFPWLALLIIIGLASLSLFHSMRRSQRFRRQLREQIQAINNHATFNFPFVNVAKPE